jgi:hypothetical protein
MAIDNKTINKVEKIKESLKQDEDNREKFFGNIITLANYLYAFKVGSEKIYEEAKKEIIKVNLKSYMDMLFKYVPINGTINIDITKEILRNVFDKYCVPTYGIGISVFQIYSTWSQTNVTEKSISSLIKVIEESNIELENEYQRNKNLN